MKRDHIRLQNQAANLFLDAADMMGIDPEIRKQLRAIAQEIMDYRLTKISQSVGEDLIWLGESITEYISLGNPVIIENYHIAVRSLLAEQKNSENGGGKMGLLDRLKKANKQGDKEENKIKKDIFEAQNIVEKYITLIDEEEKKAGDFIQKAAETEKGSPRYVYFENNWTLSQQNIRNYNTSLVLAMNTLKVNSKTLSTIDLAKTTELLQRMMPNNKMVEKLADKAIEGIEDLTDKQEEITDALDYAIEEINSTIAAPVDSTEFERQVGRTSPQSKTVTTDTVTTTSSDVQSSKSPAAESVMVEIPKKISDEQIQQLLEG